MFVYYFLLYFYFSLHYLCVELQLVSLLLFSLRTYQTVRKASYPLFFYKEIIFRLFLNINGSETSSQHINQFTSCFIYRLKYGVF